MCQASPYVEWATIDANWHGASGPNSAGCVPEVATVQIWISHVEYANTGGKLYATATGANGVSAEVLITDGADSRADYSVDIPTDGLGDFVSLDVRLTSNDGVNINEYQVTWADGSIYNWPIQQWHDGDSNTNPPVRTLAVADASTLLDAPGSVPFVVETITSDRNNAATSNPQMITIWGTNGFVGPMLLSDTFAQGASDSFSLDISDIGEFVGLRLTNTGNNGWHLETLKVTYGEAVYSWVYGSWLDGNGGLNSPHSDMFMASDATRPPAANEVQTVVTLQTSSRDNAQTSGDITCTLVGTTGSSDPTVIAAGGIGARTSVTGAINHADIGDLVSINVALTGNNGVHFNEIRVIYAGATELTWLFDTETSHDGWLDGNSNDAEIKPDQDLLVADANPAIAGSGTAAIVRAATGERNNAGTNSEVLITLYGANGHAGPVALGMDMAQGAAEEYSLDIADIGELFAVKVYNTGNDGWFLETISVEINGKEIVWQFGQWLDGNGSTMQAPHSTFFYASLGLEVGSGMLSSTVHLATSFLDNAQTSNDVFVQLVGTGGSSDEVLAGNGLSSRAGLDVTVIHPDTIGELTGVTVRLDGNNGLHLAEVRVDYGLGSDNYAVYSWILSELNGWLDGNSASPPSRTFDVASASPAIDGTGTAIDVTTVTGTRNNAQSGHTFMISFYGSNGHTIPTILSSGFENGATDSFSYDTGDLGDFCE